MSAEALRPFWRYYGGKYRAAPRYPRPMLDTIVEPFAGAAGYATRYAAHNVILIEKYQVIAEIWRYLIGVSASEILRIPANVQHVDDLPLWVPQPARDLIGWWLNAATVSPRKQLSVGRKRLALTGRKFEGWTEATRARVASQVDHIRHWQIIEGDYTNAPDIAATWFIDPPYNNRAGSYYVESDVDYAKLARWCRGRSGQLIVCENEGATWLPFKYFATLKAGVNGKGSREVAYTDSPELARALGWSP